MNKKIIVNGKYKNRGNGYIYYVLEEVVNKSEKNKIFILYGDLMVGNQLYVMEKNQFLEEFKLIIY